MDVTGGGASEPRRYTGRFVSGRVSISPGAMKTGGANVMLCLKRHLSGDWGDVTDTERAANEAALGAGGPLRSVYRTEHGEIVVTTDAERTMTVVLTADEEKGAWKPSQPNPMVQEPKKRTKRS